MMQNALLGQAFVYRYQSYFSFGYIACPQKNVCSTVKRVPNPPCD